MVTPYEYKMKVRFSDTDLYGVAHHSNYYKWLEEARIELLEEIVELSLGWFEQRKIRFPVISVEGKYKRSIMAREEITILVLLYYNNTSKLRFTYTIYNDKNQVAYTGVTEHVVVIENSMRLKMPKEFETMIFEKVKKYKERFIVIC